LRSDGGLKSQDVKNFLEIFDFFLEKRPLTVKCSKFYSESFIAIPIDVLCSNFVKFGEQEIGEIVRYLPDKKFRVALQLSLLRRWRPKSVRASPFPPQCAQSAPYFIQIG